MTPMAHHQAQINVMVKYHPTFRTDGNIAVTANLPMDDILVASHRQNSSKVWKGLQQLGGPAQTHYILTDAACDEFSFRNPPLAGEPSGSRVQRVVFEVSLREIDRIHEGRSGHRTNSRKY